MVIFLKTYNGHVFKGYVLLKKSPNSRLALRWLIYDPRGLKPLWTSDLEKTPTGEALGVQTGRLASSHCSVEKENQESWLNYLFMKPKMKSYNFKVPHEESYLSMGLFCFVLSRDSHHKICLIYCISVTKNSIKTSSL